jgi:hypothetical protein
MNTILGRGRSGEPGVHLGSPPLQSSDPSGRGRWATARGVVLPVVLAAVVIAALAALAASAGRFQNTDRSLRCHTVSRGDLSMRVVACGSLESQENLEIKCEVDDVPGARTDYLFRPNVR